MIADKARFRAARKLERAAGFRLPDHVFSGGFLEAVGRGVNFENLDRRMQENLLAIFRDFMDCKCKNAPYCGCPERKFTSRSSNYVRWGLTTASAHLLEEYGSSLPC